MGKPQDVTDPNSEETSYAYDALWRVTGVWLPGQS
jgi:YD repeat-containing protein